MKAHNEDLVHKTVAELFDMIKSRQEEIDELQKTVSDQLVRIGQLEKRIDGLKKIAIQKKTGGLFYWA